MKRTRIAAAFLLAGLLGPMPPAHSQEEGPDEEVAATTQPREFPSHEELVELAAKAPLLTPVLKTAADRPLSEEETRRIEDAKKDLAAVDDLRNKGDYAAAAQSADQALQSFQEILGGAHHLTVSAAVASRTLAFVQHGSASNRDDLKKADELFDEAERQLKAGLFIPARDAALRVVEMKERIFDKESAELVDPLRVAGAAQIELNSLAEAEKNLQRSLSISERTFGKNHPKTALVLDRIGWLNIYQGKASEAAQALRRAVYVLTTAEGETGDLAESLDNLGTALAYNGDVREALRDKLRSLVIRERRFGPEARETGVSLSNVAWLYGRMGLLDRVLPLRKRALAIFEEHLGPDHRDTRIESGNLAQAYRTEGKFAEAIDLLKRIVETDQRGGAPISPEAIGRITLLATCYLEAGRQAEGRAMLDRGIQQATALYDRGEIGAAIREMNSLAQTCERRRMYGKSAEIRGRVAAWDSAQPQRVDPARIRRSNLYARDLLHIGRAEEARAVAETTLKATEAVFGQGAKETSQPLQLLAQAYWKLGRLDDAARRCSEAIRVAEANYGADSYPSATALLTLARIQIDKNDYDLAQFSLEEAQDRMEKLRRASPIRRIELERALGRCALASGDREKGIELLRTALENARKTDYRFELYQTALVAESLHPLIEALDESAPERSALVQELRDLLSKLQKADACTAENKQWAEKYGVSAR